MSWNLSGTHFNLVSCKSSGIWKICKIEAQRRSNETSDRPKNLWEWILLFLILEIDIVQSKPVILDLLERFLSRLFWRRRIYSIDDFSSTRWMKFDKPSDHPRLWFYWSWRRGIPRKAIKKGKTNSTFSQTTTSDRNQGSNYKLIWVLSG